MSSFVKQMQKALEPVLSPPKAEQRTFFDSYDPYDPYPAKNNYTWNSGRTGYTPPKSYTPPKKIHVVEKDGTETPYTVPYDCEGWFAIAQQVWPTTDSVMRVPADHCTFEYGEPSFNACVYTATSDYVQARWGRKLDESDRRWLAAHPLVKDSGVPQEYTATCIGQLVEPYGLRVSKLRIRRGSLVLGDAVMAWIQALGCNPLALADRVTTNAEAAQRMGMPVDQADALWRVEFHDDPLPCSIVGERGWTSQSGIATGAGGGHARYLAPRSRGNDWFISVQLDLDHFVSYLVPPPNPEYVPRRGAPTLMLGSITGPDGKLIAHRVNNTWASVDGTAVVVAVKEQPPMPTQVPHSRFDEPLKLAYCLCCGEPEEHEWDFMRGADVCYDCIDAAWQGYSCPHCGHSFDRLAPDPVAFDDTSYDWQCNQCKQTVAIASDGSNADLHMLGLCEAVFLNKPYVSPHLLTANDGDWV